MSITICLRFHLTILKFNDKHFKIQNGLDENENSLNGLAILQDINIQKHMQCQFQKMIITK
jgi:hypothetical protein